MKKTLIISIMVDNVELSELEVIQTSIEHILKEHKDKRITIQIQDEPLVIRQR